MPGVRRRAGGVTGEPADELGGVRGLQVHAGHGWLPVSWSGLLACAGVGEPVGVGAGFVDGAAEGEPVHDGGAEPRVGEGLGPAASAFVGGDRHACFFLAFGQDLEQQLGPTTDTRTEHTDIGLGTAAPSCSCTTDP
jgi:hypothetical protein